jgi:RNA 2',3'-cyclic 3'-phosphodiesterase
MRRLFFALWPTAAMQSELAAAVRAAVESVRGGREVPRENLHVTLAFLGSVPESSLPALRELAADAPQRLVNDAPQQLAGDAPRAPGAGALGVTLDTIAYWPRAGILCATANRKPAEAARFADGLRQALCAAGFSPDLKPFRAHVTFARKVRGGPPDRRMPAVRWTFSDFALVESRTGSSDSLYSVLDRWPLVRA